MSMSAAHLFVALVAMVFYARETCAADIRGSVFLMPVDSSFSSVGDARYLNDLNHPASAALSGTHRVTGPQVFSTPVYGSGIYHYTLMGPAQPGACYGTTLYVVANPPVFGNTVTKTFTGATRCAPPDDPGEGNPADPPLEDNCSPNCGSPLILDLDGDGVHTTGADRPVRFDIDGDGDLEKVGWTDPATEEAFLWVDLNGNHTVDSGRELFGTGTQLPDGTTASHGFEALAIYDRPDRGGNGDGKLSDEDRRWRRLRLWIDENHDGVCQREETAHLAERGVLELYLFAHRDTVADGAGNWHMRGNYLKSGRRPRRGSSMMAMDDVFFMIIRDHG
jgi:hypothetical protein